MDSVAALIVCAIIGVGALGALGAWIRELHQDLMEQENMSYVLDAKGWGDGPKVVAANISATLDASNGDRFVSSKNSSPMAPRKPIMARLLDKVRSPSPYERVAQYDEKSEEGVEDTEFE